MILPSQTSPRRQALLWVVFGVCMISYSGPMVKGALQTGATPISIALVRMVSAGLLLLPFELRSAARQRISFSLLPSHWLWITVAAFFLAGHYLTWITSLTGTSTFASVALVCTQPLFVALFSYLLFRETIPLRALPGALLALLGAVVIALAGSLEGGAAAGQSLGSNLLALLGAVFMAAHWLTGRHVRASLPAQVYTPILYLITALLIACCLPLLGPFGMPLAAVPYMAGLVLGSTLLGHALLSRALSQVSAGLVSFALLAEPVGAMVFAIVFFQEIPTPWVLAGGGLTLLGLCLYLAYEGRHQGKEEGPPAA